MIKRPAGVLFVMLVLLTPSLAQKKRFYIANDDHTDYVWSGDEAAYKAAMLGTLDKYLVQVDSSIQAGLPFTQQAKYNCDGSFWVWQYEKNRTAAQMKNLIDKVRSGHITVPYNPLAVLYGGLPVEASIRGMYYAGYLQKKYALNLTLGISMESQVLPLGLSSLWAGSGVRYSWKGVCGCASKLKNTDLQKRENEVYYYKGLDGQQVLTKWYGYSAVKSPCGPSASPDFGGYAEARCLTDFLIGRMREKSASTKKDIIGAFGFGWDDLQTYTNQFITLAKASTTAEEEVIVSNETDYFRDMEASYGAVLPAETVAGGNEWDLYIASMAEVSAMVKRSTEKLRAAEALATVVSLQEPRFAEDLAAMRDSAWMSVGLYPEHDWTADGPVKREERAAFERRLEQGYRRYVDTLYERSVHLLGKQIRQAGTGQQFFVFNPLNWTRNDFADIVYSGPADVVVVDVAAKKQVLSQTIIKEGRTYLRILAAGVPPVGYKIFQVSKGSPSRVSAAASLSGSSFENSRFRLTLTRGGVITSLADKESGNRELVKASPLGGFANDMGSGSSGQGEELVIENAGPVSVTLKARSTNGLKHTAAVTLYHALIPRVDIQNTIEQNFSSLVSNTFSFNLGKPDTWHEEVGAVIKARLIKDGGHYAGRNARYDWLTLNHFAAMGDKDYTVSLANKDCYFFKPGNSTPETLDGGASYIQVLVGGQTDGEKLGIRNQGGDSLFRQAFSLSASPYGFDKVRSMKASLEFQQPLVTGMVTGEAGASLPSPLYSFLTISHPGLLLWALKPAEEGIQSNGIIARVWNLTDMPVQATLGFTRAVSSATETTHVEVDIRPALTRGRSVLMQVNGQQMKSYRIRQQQAQ